MKFLITSDIHLTDRPRDEYRWSVFEFLAEHGNREGVSAFFILGDLTDAKDKHSARLVNRTVRELTALADVAPVYVLKGNHDYVDPKSPFFGFLDRRPERASKRAGGRERARLKGRPERLEAGARGVLRFVSEPAELDADGERVLLLPHAKVWPDRDLAPYDLILCHQTFWGAVASNGATMTGVPVSVFGDSDATIVSGDIHVPQQLGPVYYVGAPHPVRMGDEFEPRVFVYEKGRLRSIRRKTVRMLTRTMLPDEGWSALQDAEPGDFVRIRYDLPHSRFGEWPDLKKEIERGCRERGLVVHSIRLASADETADVELPEIVGRDPFASYCEAKGYDERLIEIGRKLLEA